MLSHYPDHDTAVTSWFAKNGWTVTARYYDFDREIFAWRDEAASPRVTLRVSQEVLDDVPAAVLISAFDSLELAKVLQSNPAKYILVRGTPSVGTRVEVLDSPP